MTMASEKTNKFLNSREWRTFLSAGQAAASYPTVMRTLKAGQAWLSQAWASDTPTKSSARLIVEQSLAPVPGETLGI
jgi:antibiotic biosynthesis monooxygenase (ABM) superfamily enzyme